MGLPNGPPPPYATSAFQKAYATPISQNTDTVSTSQKKDATPTSQKTVMLQDQDKDKEKQKSWLTRLGSCLGFGSGSGSGSASTTAKAASSSSSSTSTSTSTSTLAATKDSASSEKEKQDKKSKATMKQCRRCKRFFWHPFDERDDKTMQICTRYHPGKVPPLFFSFFLFPFSYSKFNNFILYTSQFTQCHHFSLSPPLSLFTINLIALASRPTYPQKRLDQETRRKNAGGKDKMAEPRIPQYRDLGVLFRPHRAKLQRESLPPS